MMPARDPREAELHGGWHVPEPPAKGVASRLPRHSLGAQGRATRSLLGILVLTALLVASLGAVETLSQRRRRVEEMSAEHAEQLEDLFHNEQQFRDLKPQEQQRIRDLHDQIESAPDREKLRATMNRYCKWFETQPPFRRSMLLDKKKPLDDRIKTVKELLRKQGPPKDLHLDDKNRRVLAVWLDRYTAENGPRFIESMPQGSHPGIAKLPTDRQQVALREMLLRRWQMGGPGGQMPAISEREMARLRAALSPDLRSKLEAKKPGEQARIIADWLRETASHELDEELASFFENSIDVEERDRLMGLPANEMYDELGKQYRNHVLKQSKPGEPRPAWQHGHRNGPRGSDGRRRPDDRGEPGAEKDSQSNNPLAAPEKPPAEKHGSEKASSEKPSEKPVEKPAAKKPDAEPRE